MNDFMSMIGYDWGLAPVAGLRRLYRRVGVRGLGRGLDCGSMGGGRQDGRPPVGRSLLVLSSLSCAPLFNSLIRFLSV